MPKSQNNYCWIPYKVKDVKRGMWITKILSKTPRKVSGVMIPLNSKVATIVCEGAIYLDNISCDHVIDVLCYSGNHKPVTDEVL